MNSVKVLVKRSSEVMYQRLQSMKTQSLARTLRLTLYKSKQLSWSRPTRRKWPRRVLLASAGLGTVTVGLGVKQDSNIGPIYNFENTNDYDLPLDYNISAMEHFFNDRPLEILQRSGEIVSEVLPYLARLFIWEYFIRRKIRDHEGLQKKYAVELRELLTRLGPCFIKLGQAISIRPDLMPSSFLFELQKLCDAVPSFPTKEAIEVIESSLGCAVGDVFEGLDQEVLPIAAASLGQVYRLTLKEDGRVVAVKVQRPDMHHYVLRDIYIMRIIARTFQKVKQTFTYQRPFDVALLDTFASATLKELDYINEAQNQLKCKEDLEPRMNQKIYIPEVYEKLTTRKVLVTEWIEGCKLAASPASVINRLIPVGVECFLIQLLDTGFFHADPHPGNLLVTPDGRLALIDFGFMADVPIQDTKTMTKTIVHLMQGDVPGLVEDAIDLGFLPEDVDKSSLIPTLQNVFDSAQLAVTDEVKSNLTYKAIQGRRKKFWAVSSDLNKIFYLYPFLVPDYFALITRAMIVLEGIAVTGDPDFDLFKAAYPYSLSRAIQIFGYSGVVSIAKEMAGRLRDVGIQEKETDQILQNLK